MARARKNRMNLVPNVEYQDVWRLAVLLLTKAGGKVEVTEEFLVGFDWDGLGIAVEQNPTNGVHTFRLTRLTYP